jgi:hypothetical protein
VLLVALLSPDFTTEFARVVTGGIAASDDAPNRRQHWARGATSGVMGARDRDNSLVAHSSKVTACN